MIKCENCGKETINPRFCGRSCAAQTNNKSSVKRMKKKKCKSCEALILSNRTYCSECNTKSSLNVSIRQDPVVTIETYEGPVQINVKPASVKGEMHYSPWDSQSSELVREPTCGNFLKLFLGILLGEPPYLPKEELSWIIPAVYSLMESKSHLVSGNRGLVKDEPIFKLSGVVYHWLESIELKKPFSAIQRCHAVAVAELIQKHWNGDLIYTPEITYRLNGASKAMGEEVRRSFKYFSRREQSKLGAMLVGLESASQDFFYLGLPQFKKELTENIRNRALVVEVPPGEQLVDNNSGEVILEAGGRFLFVIERGHLSRGGFYDHESVKTKVQNPIRNPNLLHDYKLWGYIPDVKKYNWNSGSWGGHCLYLPVRWCRGVVDMSNNERLVELPNYLKSAWSASVDEKANWPFGMELGNIKRSWD